MLVQDTLTGSVHQVPEDAMYGHADHDTGELYDGYGNPVGFPPLLPLLASLAPVVLPPLMKAVASGFKGPDGYSGYAADEGVGWYGEDEEGDYDYDDWDEDLEGGQVVYDGFGNPVGFAPLVKLATRALPTVAKLARRFVPGLAPGAQALMRRAPSVMRNAQRVMQSMASRRRVPARYRPRMPFPLRRPGWPRRIPPGWMRRPMPYTGPSGRPVYMTCKSWPGPAGLVPVRPGVPALRRGRPVRRRRRRGRRRR